MILDLKKNIKNKKYISWNATFAATSSLYV